MYRISGNGGHPPGTGREDTQTWRQREDWLGGRLTDYDCQRCGACCVDYFGTTGYIQLTADEKARMRRMSLPVVLWHGQELLGTRPHAGPGGETCCVAFTGEVGSHCACAIHPDRPSACREFEAGSEGCKFARMEVGLPV